MKISIVGESLIGTREEQQDSYIYRVTDELAFAAVCDGMGGLNGGRIASEAVVKSFKEDVLIAMPITNCSEFLKQEATKLDNLVFYLEDENGQWLKAGTTIVSVVILNGELYFLTAGDSMLYMQRGSEMIAVNREHNYELQLKDYLKKGNITKEEYDAELKARGGALVSYIGVGNISVMDVNRKPIKLKRKDRLLLCSDGLTKIFSIDELRRIMISDNDIKHISATIKGLIAKKSISNQDNTTYIIIQVD